jgi:hypothetical protein
MSCVATTDFFNKIGQEQTFAAQNGGALGDVR